MADQPEMSSPAAGARAVPEVQARAGTWSIGLAALGLVAVIGGLAAGVVSVAGEPRPPDLGGPILAPRSAPTATSTATPAPVSRTAGRLTPLPPQVFAEVGEQRAAAPVPVRALPVVPGGGAGSQALMPPPSSSAPDTPGPAPAERPRS
ncbi:conserved hypothetical protein [Frankia sp. AgKG'84/4]